MKRVFALLLALCMLVALTACGASGSFGVESIDGVTRVSAQNAGEGSSATGYVLVETGQMLEIQADLRENSVMRVELVPLEGDAQAVCAEEIRASGTQSFTVPAGEYTLLVSAQKGTTGSMTIRAVGWSRAGYFAYEDSGMLSITWMEDMGEPGWYVGVMVDELMGGWSFAQEGDTLRGNLYGWDDSAEPLMATVTEEGENGVRLTLDSGESWLFTPMELPQATIFVNVNVEGWGCIDHAEGEEPPVIDPDYPFQSAVINLAEPAVYTLVAWPEPGNVFVKWTKNGEDFSTEPQITLLLDESADYIAVFEEDPDWHSPLEPYFGEYQSGRAHATVDSLDAETVIITIEWGSSAWELARWVLFVPVDFDTMSGEYSGCPKIIVVYDNAGELVSEEYEYEDGSGSIVFHEDGSFTWHEDQSPYEMDMLFEPVAPEG